MKYVFCITQFDPKSGGVRGMYFLAECVRRLGIEVVINEACGPDDIMVLLDQKPGMDLDARRVIRFFGYYPSEWYGNRRIPKEELAVIYEDRLREETQALYDGELGPEMPYPLIEPGLFYPEPKRIENLLYVCEHKSRVCRHQPDIKGLQVITRGSHSREEAAAMLRQTRNFYTNDDFTAILPEAAMCGCNVLIVRGEGEYEPYIAPNPEARLMTEENGLAYARRFTAAASAFFDHL